MKISEKLKKVASRVAGAVTGIGVTAATSITAFAAEGSNEAVEAAKTLMQQVTGTLNLTNIVAILGAGIGVVILLFLGWWGARKLIRMVMDAFKKGRVSL